MKKLLLASIALVIFSIQVFALISEKVAFEESELKSPIEKDFFNDLDNGKLEKFNYYDAFIIASDITKESDFIYYQDELKKIREKALKGINNTEDPYDVAKKLLIWLHDNTLKKYRYDATLVSDIIDNGEFNCLSASVLYAILANDLGLDVSGVIVKDHAFCMLKDPRGDKDIETTVRYGFDPGTREIEQLKEVTRYIYVPKKEYALRRNVTILQLIGALYSNLAGAVVSKTEQEKIDFEAELPKYKKGYFFDQEAKVFTTDIGACLNNLALKYMEKKEYDSAYKYLRQARKFDPENEDFKNLEKKYFSDKAMIEIKLGNYEKGIGYMKIALGFYPKDEKLLNNLAVCYVSWGNTFFEKKDFESASISFSQGFKLVPENEALRQNTKASFFNYAIEQYNKKRFVRAVEIANKGLDLFPDDTDFIKIKQASEGLNVENR